MLVISLFYFQIRANKLRPIFGVLQNVDRLRKRLLTIGLVEFLFGQEEILLI